METTNTSFGRIVKRGKPSVPLPKWLLPDEDDE